MDASVAALEGAAAPRIHIFIASSPLHMEHKLRMTPQQVLESAVAAVRYAKKYIDDVEFSAEDATRSDVGFLKELFSAAIAAGATTVNVADTVGYATPNEFYRLIHAVKTGVEGIDRAVLSVHCHNDLGMGVANSVSAIAAGASQVECTLSGIASARATRPWRKSSWPSAPGATCSMPTPASTQGRSTGPPAFWPA